MKFDVIDISDEEIEKLNSAQLTLLRTAQQKSDELTRQVNEDFWNEYEKICSAGMVNSTLIDDMYTVIYDEYNYKLDVLKDNLIYSMSLKSGEDKDESSKTGYLVDYSLSYDERYSIVRKYYLAIKDREERMNKYRDDEVAMDYLGSYYNILYNLLSTYEDYN